MEGVIFTEGGVPGGPAPTDGLCDRSVGGPARPPWGKGCKV
jgi:hypothetical protein